MVKDKVILITGASEGLGKELAQQLSELGAKTALIARTEETLKSVKDGLKNESEYFVCDVTDREQVKSTVKAVVEKFGTIDILINNAGIWTTDALEETKPELIEASFKVNSLGPIYLVKEILPIMKERNTGHILNVISKAGLDIPDNKDWPTYSATKWAVTGYTKALGYSLSDTKIKVSGYYPGGFESNIFETAGEEDAHDQPWMMKTEDVAKAIVYILDAPEDLYIKGIELSNI